MRIRGTWSFWAAVGRQFPVSLLIWFMPSSTDLTLRKSSHAGEPIRGRGNLGAHRPSRPEGRDRQRHQPRTQGK